MRCQCRSRYYGPGAPAPPAPATATSAYRVAVLAVSLLMAPPSAAAAQSTLDRPPNITGGWLGERGVLQFNFLHRFSVSDAPQRKVSNSPTFLLAYTLPWRVLAGFNYSTNSITAPNYPNEWELFARVVPLAQDSTFPVDASLQGGYNVAAKSADGELTVGRRFSRVRVMAVGRAFSDGYDSGDGRVAAGGGASIRLSKYFALAGDVTSLVNRRPGEKIAWSGGVQIAIPYTPHTLSLHATNATTGTLQGESRGTDQTLYGFEFTIPFHLSRYFGRKTTPKTTPQVATPAVADTTHRAATRDTSAQRVARDTTAKAAPKPAAPGGLVVPAAMRQITFTPGRIEITAGTVVEWKNDDPLVHTVTADDGSWDSGNIQPGATWRRTFDRPGTYPFHCTPHPFMKGVVVVR
jgi:plastocyanin